MVISLAGLTYGVIATLLSPISTIFFTEHDAAAGERVSRSPLRQYDAHDWVIVFAFAAFVLIAATNPFTGNGTSWLFEGIKTWRYGKLHKRSQPRKLLKRQVVSYEPQND